MVALVEREPADVFSGFAGDQPELSADGLRIVPACDEALDPGQVRGGERPDRGTPEPVVETVEEASPARRSVMVSAPIRGAEASADPAVAASAVPRVAPLAAERK